MWVIGTAIVREWIDAQVWTTLSNNYSPSPHLWNWHNIHTVESRKSCDEMRWSYLMLYYPQGFHYLVCAVDSNWQHWDREASSIIKPWSAAPLRCMHSVSSSRTLSRWHVHHRIVQEVKEICFIAIRVIIDHYCDVASDETISADMANERYWQASFSANTAPPTVKPALKWWGFGCRRRLRSWFRSSDGSYRSTWSFQ